MLSELGETARRHDPAAYLAAILAPASAREALFLLAAFDHELARAVDRPSHAAVTPIRLQWWRDVVEGAPRRHPVATPLLAAIEKGALPAEALGRMIDGREAEADGPPSLATWLAMLRAVGGGRAIAAGHVLGAGADLRDRLERVGGGIAGARMLCRMEVLAARGRCVLPEELLACHGLTAEAAIAAPALMRPVLEELGRAVTSLLGRPARWPREVVAAVLPASAARRPGALSTGLGMRLRMTASAFRGVA